MGPPPPDAAVAEEEEDWMLALRLNRAASAAIRRFTSVPILESDFMTSLLLLLLLGAALEVPVACRGRVTGGGVG